MAKIISSEAKAFRKKAPEEAQTKQFNTYEDILDWLYTMKVKPSRCTIWKYFDKWCISYNFK